MKEAILANCEKSFIQEAISKTMRLDGRQLDEWNNLEIYFGTEYGSCQVSLGNTKVLAKVSCEVTQPSATRPNEGVLYVNVEFSPMGASHFEAGRPTELAIQVNRFLEKCLKDSHCVDLESLCIASDDKVWALRVDVHILNHEGSLVDAASVAALSALAHFRRPDVTTDGEETIIHDSSERDPIPLSLHHYPVCLTFALFNGGNNFVSNPTYLEERVSEAQLVFGVNSYRELCSLHLGGSAIKNTQALLSCASRASARALLVVQQIKEALAKDTQSRAEQKDLGFVECISKSSIFSQKQAQLSISLSSLGLRQAARQRGKPAKSVEGDRVLSRGNSTAELISSQEPIPKSSSEDDDESDLEVIEEVSRGDKCKQMIVPEIELSDGSEEEETITLKQSEMAAKKKTGLNRKSNKGGRPR